MVLEEIDAFESHLAAAGRSDVAEGFGESTHVRFHLRDPAAAVEKVDGAVVILKERGVDPGWKWSRRV